MEVQLDPLGHRSQQEALGYRTKSSGRMRYEAEVTFLKRQNGSLDEVRQKLGLSRRKICQLLLVDPSAWTRWTGSGADAPPHIYRALDWYLSILEKDPEYRRLAARFAGWLSRERNHEGRLARIESKLSQPQRSRANRLWDYAALALAFLSGVLFTYFLFRARS